MRFTLQTLMLSVMVVWSSLAVFGPKGLAVAAILLAMAAYIRTSESMWRAAAIVCLLLLFGLCLLGLFLPAVNAVRELSRRVSCMNNLKQIALGLSVYHHDHGCFPPAYVAGADGKPMHSWRVLVLPYLEGKGLYDRYDFNEPWNGPNNSKLAASRPLLYACPSSKGWASGSATADYVAVVGPETAWPKDKKIKDAEISDGLANTIMLVEIDNSDINWMEPRDLSLEELRRAINPKSASAISSRHVQGNGYFYHETPVVHVAFADGSVRSLPVDFSPKTLEALLTVDEGEAVQADQLIEVRLNWTRCVAVVVLVLSFVLLLIRPR